MQWSGERDGKEYSKAERDEREKKDSRIYYVAILAQVFPDSLAGGRWCRARLFGRWSVRAGAHRSGEGGLESFVSSCCQTIGCKRLACPGTD